MKALIKEALDEKAAGFKMKKFIDALFKTKFEPSRLGRDTVIAGVIISMTKNSRCIRIFTTGGQFTNEDITLKRIKGYFGFENIETSAIFSFHDSTLADLEYLEKKNIMVVGYKHIGDPETHVNDSFAKLF